MKLDVSLRHSMDTTIVIVHAETPPSSSNVRCPDAKNHVLPLGTGEDIEGMIFQVLNLTNVFVMFGTPDYGEITGR